MIYMDEIAERNIKMAQEINEQKEFMEIKALEYALSTPHYYYPCFYEEGERCRIIEKHLSEGKTLLEIAGYFNVTRQAIKYHYEKYIKKTYKRHKKKNNIEIYAIPADRVSWKKEIIYTGKIEGFKEDLYGEWIE